MVIVDFSELVFWFQMVRFFAFVKVIMNAFTNEGENGKSITVSLFC
jgi:hypothetical protein